MLTGEQVLGLDLTSIEANQSQEIVRATDLTRCLIDGKPCGELLKLRRSIRGHNPQDNGGHHCNAGERE